MSSPSPTKPRTNFPEKPARQEYDVHISTATVLKIIGIIAGVLFLWVIRDVIGILFVSLVLASAFDPWVDKLERYRIPRGLAVLTMYFVFLLIVGSVIYLIIPPLVTQISDITSSLKEYSPFLDSVYQSITQSTPDVSFIDRIQQQLANLNSTLTNVTSGIFHTLTGVFGKIAGVIFVLVITFYMTVEEDGIKKFVRSIAPIKYQPYLVQKTNRIQVKMGAWLRGQLTLMVIVGVLAFIGLFILDVPYALVLACIAGLFEFVPYLGPTMSAIPAIFFAYNDSPWKSVGVLIMFVIIQQLENQVIVPKVMQKAVGLNPIVVIAAMLIGAKIAGFGGILLAVPAATILWIFLEDIFEQKKKIDNQLEEPTGDVQDELS